MRLLGWAFFGLGMLALLVLVARGLDLEVPLATGPLTRATVRLIAGVIDAPVEIGAVHATFGQRIVVDDVRVRVDGAVVARIPRVEIAYAVLPLLRGRLALARVALARPWLRAVRTAAGWRLPGLRPAGGGGSGTALTVDRLEIEDGRLEVALEDAAPPRRFAATALDLHAGVRLASASEGLRLESLRLVPRGVSLGPVTASADAERRSGGLIRLAALAVDTGRSRLTARGDVDPGRSVDADLRLDPLAAADVRALAPSAGLRADVRSAARARGPWRAIATTVAARLSPGGRVAGHALVDATRPRPAFAAHARFRELDPGAVVQGLPDASLDGHVAANGTGVDTRAALGYRLALARSRVAQVAVDRLDLAGRARAGVHSVRARAEGSPGRADLRARVALGPAIAYRAALRYDVRDLERLLAGVPGRVAGRARLAGRGTAADDRRASLGVTATAGSVQGRPLRRADVHAELVNQDVRLTAASVDVERLHAEATGAVDLARREGDVSLAVDGDLAAIHPGVGGTIVLAARARGPFDAAGVEANATLADMAFRDVAAREARVRATASGLGGPQPRAEAHLDAADVRFRAGSTYAARSDVDWRRAAVEDRVGLTVDAHADDGSTQTIRLALVRTPERTTGELGTLVLTPPEGTVWRLASPTTFTIDDGLSTAGMTLVSGAQRIALAGRIAFRGASRATLRLEDVALAPVCALASAPPCTGTVSGNVLLGGTATAPVVDLAARADPLRVHDVDYAIALTVHHAEAVAKVDLTVREPTAGTLTATGTVPVDLAWAGTRRDLRDAPLALTVRAAGLDLAIVPVLVPRTVREARGRLDLELQVRGSRAAPRPAGTVNIADGALELATTGIAYERIQVAAVADGARVTLRALHAEAGEGKLDGRGSLDARAGGPMPLDVTLDLDRFAAVRQHAYEATLSGTVALRGTLEAPDVTGGIDVDHAVVRPASLPGSGPAIRQDPTVTVVGEPVPEVQEPPGSPAIALGEALHLSMRVRIAHDAWIRRNDANIELGGELQVTKAPGEAPRITGQIQLVRGWYEFQGRRFDLEPGSTITFTGAAPPAPVLDLTAVRATRDYRIEVKVTGPIEKPKLELSSDPPLEQADILSVLLFGKPANELGRGQSVALQQQALQLATGYVMPELRTSVMNTLGLDTLDVQMPEQSTAPGRVSAGRYVAEDVFVSLAQEFGTRTAEVVGLEYSLSRSVSIKGSTSTRGNSAIDLFWQYRY